jgi:hypothetical protein
MAEAEKVTVPEEKIPLGQVFLDDIFLLLALGMSVPMVLYIAWGLLDLLNVPILP